MLKVNGIQVSESVFTMFRVLVVLLYMNADTVSLNQSMTLPLSRIPNYYKIDSKYTIESACLQDKPYQLCYTMPAAWHSETVFDLNHVTDWWMHLVL